MTTEDRDLLERFGHLSDACAPDDAFTNELWDRLEAQLHDLGVTEDSASAEVTLLPIDDPAPRRRRTPLLLAAAIVLLIAGFAAAGVLDRGGPQVTANDGDQQEPETMRDVVTRICADERFAITVDGREIRRPSLASTLASTAVPIEDVERYLEESLEVTQRLRVELASFREADSLRPDLERLDDFQQAALRAAQSGDLTGVITNIRSTEDPVLVISSLLIDYGAGPSCLG